eukprot:TRINITY_DN10028_c0_g1_i1.p1 TRINITY_DN10028_c0_g1~~TRINITY_DN10028_c0_g1_i1.p1  ORF type:complete len:230 (+),score=50.13 TRINITY_DN10028_c0_g1_i1:121-810(+)
MCIRDRVYACTDGFSTTQALGKFMRNPFTISVPGKWARAQPDPAAPLFITDMYCEEFSSWVLFVLLVPSNVWGECSETEHKVIQDAWRELTTRDLWGPDSSRAAVVDVLPQPYKLKTLLTHEYQELGRKLQDKFEKRTQQDHKYEEKYNGLLEVVKSDLMKTNERERILVHTNELAEDLVVSTGNFAVSSKELKNKYCWQNCKWTLLVVGFLLAIIGVIAVVVYFTTKK